MPVVVSVPVNMVVNWVFNMVPVNLVAVVVNVVVVVEAIRAVVNNLGTLMVTHVVDVA